MMDNNATNPLIDRAAQLVEAAKKAGADAADAVVISSQSLTAEVRHGVLENTARAENDGFSLRVFYQGRVASISANDSGSTKALAERAISMAKLAPQDPYASLADRDKLATGQDDTQAFDETVVEADQLVAMAKECEAAGLGVEGITNTGGASASWGAGGLVLITSHGFCGSYSSSSFSLSASFVAGEGTAMERDFDYDMKRFFEDLAAPSEVGKQAGERTVKRLNPRKVETRSLPVLYDPRVATGLVGHLAGAINGASIARKTSFLQHDKGKAICRPDVTINDNPHQRRGLASRPFDGEGVAAKPADMVKEGVLQDWFLDTATARELGLETNGRASRNGSNPTPGRTNLTLHAGEKSPAELMRDIGTGLYVHELIGSGVSLVSGDYSRGASGYFIENGEIAYPVSEITIAGNLRDMFQHMIPANDLKYRFSTNAPTILVENLAVSGR